MNKKKLILIRGVLFASSLPLIAASWKIMKLRSLKTEMDTQSLYHN
ncbi:hypothetical protein HYE30_00695 [Mycoplasmopsis bovis]|nr:hypothetical protein [Mycoplasmopsis bovis]QQH22443.1 hypothetical protein HYE30_00695 [Mycoplasmopsis bovis]